MNWEAVDDFTREAMEKVGKHRQEFVLNPDQLQGSVSAVDGLVWSSIEYGKEQIKDIPDDQRGIYAFLVQVNSSQLPSNGYVMYVGIAGENSNRSLRARYSDYLSPSKILKRKGLARMFSQWRQVLRFHFAPVGKHVTNEDLIELEKRMNAVFLPPFSIRDFEATLRSQVRAFR